MAIELLRKRVQESPEDREIRETGEKLFGEISELRPHLRDDMVIYSSQTLKDVDKPPHVASLFHLINSGAIDSSVGVRFRNTKFRDNILSHDEKPYGLALSGNGLFGKSIRIPFNNRTWQAQEIIINPDDSTKSIISRNARGSLVNDNRLLVDTLSVLKDDLSCRRAVWEDELKQAGIDYSTKLAEATDRYAPDVIRGVVAAMREATKAGNAEIFGLPVERSINEVSVVHLLLTEDIDEDIAQKIYSARPGYSISNYRYTRTFPSFPTRPGEILMDAVDHGNKKRFSIDIKTVAPSFTNFGRDAYASERDFDNFLHQQRHSFNDHNSYNPKSLKDATLLWSQSPQKPIKEYIV